MFIQLTTFKDRDEGWKEFNAFVKVGTRTRAWEGFEGREINSAICIISFFEISMFAFVIFDLNSCCTKIRSRENICCCSFRYRCWWAMCLFNSLRLHYDFIVGDHNRLLFVCLLVQTLFRSFCTIFPRPMLMKIELRFNGIAKEFADSIRSQPNER